MFQSVKTLLNSLKTRFNSLDAHFDSLDTLLNSLDFGLQQIAQVVEPLVYGIAQVVDAAVLEKHSEQVTANDNSDGTPMVELIHLLHFSI